MTMNKIFDGTVHAEKQDEALATYAPKIEKADRTLDFHAPAPVLQNRVRAFSPAPGAEAMLPSGKVKITEARSLSEEPDGEPGTVSELSAKGDGVLSVNCGQGKLLILKLVPEGKKEMSAGDFIRGRRIARSDSFI